MGIRKLRHREGLRGRLRLPLVAVATGLLLCVGCTTINPPKSDLLKQVAPEATITAAALRVKVRALAPRFSGQIEELADDLARDTERYRLRLFLVRFKMNALPQLEFSLYQQDPVAALIDAWALMAQLEDGVDLATEFKLTDREKTEAKTRFVGMENEIEALWKEVSGKADVSRARERIHRWAAANPLERTLASRRSTASLLADITEATGVKPLAAAGQLLEDTRDITARLDLLTATLPKQARWQAEFLARDLLTDESFIDSTGLDIRQILDSIYRALGFIDFLPEIIDRESVKVLNAVHEERLETQAWATSERKAVVDQLHQERVATMADVDRMGRGWIDLAFDRTDRLVDKLFLRIVLLMVVALAGTAIVALLVIRAWRHGRPPESRRHFLRPRRPARV